VLYPTAAKSSYLIDTDFSSSGYCFTILLLLKRIQTLTFSSAEQDPEPSGPSPKAGRHLKWFYKILRVDIQHNRERHKHGLTLTRSTSPVMLYCAFSPLILSMLTAASSIHFNRQSNPTVVLSYGTFQGTSTQGIDSYLGIPFAQAE
jgi:hypothetical protein